MTSEGRQRAVERYVANPSVRNRNEVIAAHHYLCRRGARKFFRRTVDRADLEQVAVIGLIKASQRYNRQYETPFEAYAWLIIVGELMHFVRDYERVVRIPRNLRALERRYAKTYESLTIRLEREPRACELAAEMGVSAAVIDQVRALRAPDVPSVEDEDEGHERPCEAAKPVAFSLDGLSVEDRLSLSSALTRLSRRELRIVKEIFFYQRTQSEVGRALGISQRQVSRVLTRTLQRLARMLEAA